MLGEEKQKHVRAHLFLDYLSPRIFEPGSRSLLQRAYLCHGTESPEEYSRLGCVLTIISPSRCHSLAALTSEDSALDPGNSVSLNMS